MLWRQLWRMRSACDDQRGRRWRSGSTSSASRHVLLSGTIVQTGGSTFAPSRESNEHSGAFLTTILSAPSLLLLLQRMHVGCLATASGISVMAVGRDVCLEIACSGVTRGWRTTPGNTLQGWHPKEKKLQANLQRIVDKRGRTGKKRCGVTPSNGVTPEWNQ